MIKKFHWTLHLASALQRFKKLPACFAMERKHRFICKFASRICNTLVYEQTLLQECLAEELFHLKQPGLFTEGIHLVNGHKASKEFHALMEKTFGHKIPVEFLEVAARCKLEKAMCTKADIALAKPFSAAEVVAFVAYCGNVFAFAKSFQLDMDDEVHGSTVWLDAGEHSLVPATDLLCPLVHNRSKNKVRTLIPWQVRLHLKKQCQWALQPCDTACRKRLLALPQAAFLGWFIASFTLALSLSLQASIGFVAASLLGFAIANIALALSWQASFALALSLQAFLSFAIASLVGFGIYSWHVKLSCLYTNQCIAGLPWIMLLQALLVLSMQAVLAFCSNTLCVAFFEATSFQALSKL